MVFKLNRIYSPIFNASKHILALKILIEQLPIVLRVVFLNFLPLLQSQNIWCLADPGGIGLTASVAF